MIGLLSLALAAPPDDGEVVHATLDEGAVEASESVPEAPASEEGASEDDTDDGTKEAAAPGPDPPVTVVVRRDHDDGCAWGAWTRDGYEQTYVSELSCPDPEVGWVWHTADDPGHPDKWSFGLADGEVFIERPGRRTRTLQVPLNQTVIRIDSAYNRDLFVVTVGPESFTLYALRNDEPAELSGGESLPLTEDPNAIVEERIGRRLKMVRWSSHAPQDLTTRPSLHVEEEDGALLVQAKLVPIPDDIAPLLEGATWSYPYIRDDAGYATDVLGIGWNAAKRTVLLVEESGFRTIPVVGEGPVDVFQTDDVVWAHEEDTLSMWDLTTGHKLQELEGIVAAHPHHIID